MSSCPHNAAKGLTARNDALEKHLRDHRQQENSAQNSMNISFSDKGALAAAPISSESHLRSISLKYKATLTGHTHYVLSSLPE